MTEGTKSYLFGCHHFLIHPLCVLRAWKQIYKSWPTWWQLIGILLHDIGISGKEYLSHDKAKIGHYKKGAELSRDIVRWICIKLKFSDSKRVIIVGQMYAFVAGHCPNESGFSKSGLFIADKHSWVIAPMWWMWWNYWFEGFKGFPPPYWKALMKENLIMKEPMGGHELYMKNRTTQYRKDI